MSKDKNSENILSFMNKLHTREDLTHHLKNIEGVVWVNFPCFIVNWDTMEVPKSQNSASVFMLSGLPGGEKYSAAECKLYKMQNVERAIEFVERNKHQMVVYEMFMPPWREEEGVCIDPRPFLRCSRKPETQFV